MMPSPLPPAPRASAHLPGVNYLGMKTVPASQVGDIVIIGQWGLARGRVGAAIMEVEDPKPPGLNLLGGRYARSRWISKSNPRADGLIFCRHGEMIMEIGPAIQLRLSFRARLRLGPGPPPSPHVISCMIISSHLEPRTLPSAAAVRRRRGHCRMPQCGINYTVLECHVLLT